MSNIFSNTAYKQALARQRGYAADAFDNPLLTAADAARVGRPRQEQPQEPQNEEQPQEAPQERTYLGAAGDLGLSALAGLGNFLDVPGSSIRDIAALRNPLDQWATPFSDANRTTGRDLNRMYGLSGKDDNWGNFWGGMATEIALDPLSYFGAGLLSKAAKGVGKASKAAGLTKGIKTKVNQSLARQAKKASNSTPNVMPMSNSVADATAAVAKEAPEQLSYFPALARATPGALINSADDPVEALANFYRVGGTDEMLDKPVYSIGSAEIPIAQWIPWLKNTWMGKTAEVVSKKPVIEAIDETVKRKAKDILAAEAAVGAAKAGKGAAAAAKAAGVAAAQAADQIPTAQAGKEAAATVDNAADQTIPTPTTQAADNVVDDANTPASQEVPDAELKASNESRFSTKDFLREAKEHPVVKQSIEESGEAGIFNTIKSVLSEARRSAGSSKVNFNNILSALYSGSIDATDDTLDNISNILFDANENMLKKSSPSGKPATKTSKASKANNASGSPIQLPDSISPENLEKLKNQETWLSPEQVQRRNAALAKQAIPDVPVKYSSAQEAVGALERFRDGVTIDGINIKAVPYSGANDANPLGSLVADGGTRPMVVMEIDGVKIPFYQSTGDGGKILQRGAWYPFFGFHKDSQWINKADASGMSQYYGSRKLAKTAQALDEATGNITPLTDVGKRSEFRKATFDAGIFGTPDFLKWINDGMSPVSDTAPNKVFMANIENTIKKLEGEDWGKSPTPTKQTAPKASVATGAGKAAVNAVETAAPNNFRMEDYLNGVKQHEVVQQALTEPGGEALFDVIDDILANANKRAKTPSLSFVDDIIPAIDEVKKNPAIHEDLIEEANQVLANVHDDMVKASDASKQSPPVKQAAIPDAESVMQKFVENGKQAPWLARHEIKAFAGKGAKAKTEAAIQSLVDSGQLQVAYDSKGAAHYALPDTPITEWLATSKDGVNNLPTKKQATRKAERAAQQAAETAANTATQAGKLADEVASSPNLPETNIPGSTAEKDIGTASAGSPEPMIDELAEDTKDPLSILSKQLETLEEEIPNTKDAAELQAKKSQWQKLNNEFQKIKQQRLAEVGQVRRTLDDEAFQPDTIPATQPNKQGSIVDEVVGNELAGKKGGNVLEMVSERNNTREARQKQLEGLSKNDLLETANSRKVPVKRSMNKGQIVNSLLDNEFPQKGPDDVRGKVQEANKQAQVPGSERPEGTSSVDRPQETGQGRVPEASGAGAQAQVAGEFVPQFTNGSLDIPKTDALFDSISPKHAALNVRLTSLVSQGLMNDYEKLFVQGFFSSSDLRNMPEFGVAPLTKSAYYGILGTASEKVPEFSGNATGAFARLGGLNKTLPGGEQYALFIRKGDVMWAEKPHTVIHELAHGIFYELERKDPTLFNAAIDSVRELIAKDEFKKYFSGTEVDEKFVEYLSNNPHEALAQLLVHISADKAQKMSPSLYRLGKEVWQRITSYVKRILGVSKESDKSIDVIKDLVRYSAGFIDEAKRDEIMDSLLRIKKKSQGTYTTPSVMHSALAGAGKSQAAEATREWMQKGVRSSFFKNWFGDWESDAANASKVVDANGKPLVMYHGTNRNFTAFDPKKHGDKDHGWYGVGHYFTADPDAANGYAFWHDPGQPTIGSPRSLGSNVMPVYLSLKNPYTWPVGRPATSNIKDSEQITKELIAAGYDGIVVPSNGAAPEYAKFYEVIAFDPEQIKSATGNVGTFDIGDSDIRFMANEMPSSAADEVVDDIHRGIGDTDKSMPSKTEIEEWRASRQRNPRTRNPQLQDELLKYMRGGSQQEYFDAVRRLMPIQLIRSMPKMPTWKEIQSALSDDKLAKGIIGANKQIRDGERVGTRLDIPSYDKYDTWTVTVHAPNSNTSVYGYGKAAKLSNVDFTSSPTGAISTALGGQKNSYAKMVGNWVDETPESIYKQAQDAMNNPDEWIQVGMNPERHSWFYIKEPLGDMPAGTPVKSAKEVLQVGPLVMVKREGLTTAGKLENGKLVVDDPEFMTNLKALPEDAQNVRFMANDTPKLTLKQKMAQNTPSAAALNKAVNSWVSQAGSVGDAILDAIDSGANILMSFPFVRATVALFDAAVMGATSSVKAQDEARLVYDTIQKAIEQTRGAIVPLVRAIEGSKYFDVDNIKSTLNVTQEEASNIANQRAMQLRAAAENIDSMYYQGDKLPVELRSVVSIINNLYDDALAFEAEKAGLDITQLQDIHAKYTFRESRKPGKHGATRNPFSGPQFDTRFPSQQGRKDFLTNLPAGTSVIDELSIDQRISGLVNRVPVRAKNRKAAQAFPENIAFVVDKNGVKTVDPLNMPNLRQYLYENYGPKLDTSFHEATQDALETLLKDDPNATWQDAWKVAQEQLAAKADESVEGGLLLFDPAKDKRFDSMINWLVNLDAGYVRENQPIYGRNLLHDTMMRVEDGQKAANIAMMAQKLMGQALSKIDSATGISLATEEAPGVAWRKTMESFRMDTPVAHQNIINSMSEASQKECADELADRASHIYDEIRKALTSKKVVDPDKNKTITGSVSSKFNNKDFKYQIRNVNGENKVFKVETTNGVQDAQEVLLDFTDDVSKDDVLKQLEREYKATNNVAFLALHHMPQEMHNDITRWMKPFSVPEEIGMFRNVLDSISNVFRANVTGPFPSFHGRNLMSATVQNIIYRAYDPTQIGPMRYIKPMLDARKIRKDEAVDGIYDSIASSAGEQFARGLLKPEDFAKFKETERKKILLALVDAQSSGKKSIAEEMNKQLAAISALKDDDPKFRDMLMTRKIADLAFQYGVTGAKQGQSAEVIGDTYNALASQLPGLDKTSALDVLRGKIPAAPPDASLFDVVNPLAVQGGMSPLGTKYDADFYILARAGRMVGKSIEDTVRLAPFIAYIKQGYLPEVAADMVKHNQIDYNRLSSFERKYARSYFPFYTYSSRILASTAKDLLQHPGGRQSQLIRTINNSRDNDAMAPEYIQSSASIPLGKLPDGSDRYITGFGLGLEDAAKFSKILQGDVQGTARELFSRSNPLAKYAGELAFGRSAFYDGPEGAQSLSDLDPPIGRTLSNIRDLVTGERTERPEPFISQGFEHLVSNSPFARYGTFARQLTDPRKLETPLASATDLLTGIKVKDVSPAAQDSIAVQRAGIKFKELGGRNQSIPFMPEDKLDKLSPEDRQSVEAIQQLLKDVKERRKARREMEEARINEVR